MGYTWRQRLANWLCEVLGHRVQRDDFGNDICNRCNRLLSTEYSRTRTRAR